MNALAPMDGRHGIGGNLPPDPFTLYEEHISGLVMEASNWLDGSGVHTDDEADAVSALLGSIRQAEKDADKARADEKRPHDEAGKAVQARWKPLLDRAALATRTAKDALTPFLQAKEAAQRAEADAKRVEAQRLADEAQEALQASAGNLDSRIAAEALLKDAGRAERDANRADKAKAHATGGERAVGLRSSWRAEITDPTAFARWVWANRKSEMTQFLEGVATREARGGDRGIPGLKSHEEKRVA